MHLPSYRNIPSAPTRRRHRPRLATILALVLILGLVVGNSAARAQTFPHLVLDETTGVAEMSWSDLTAGHSYIPSPEVAFHLESPPSFGQLVDMEEQKVYVPAPQFWVAGGDSFSFTFEGSPAPAVLVTITSPRIDLFGDDMESGDATAWGPGITAVEFPEHPVHGRRLRVTASPTTERFLRLEISGIPTEPPLNQGGANQNTGTTMVVDLGDPGGGSFPGMEGDMVLWERVDDAHSTRLHLRMTNGLPEVRAENGLDGAVGAATAWTSLAVGTPQDVAIRHEAQGSNESLVLSVDGQVTSVADDNAYETSSEGVHRLGALDVDGLDGLTVQIDDFRTGSVPIAGDRVVIADDFESGLGGSASPSGWMPQGSQYLVFGRSEALSGTGNLGIDLEDAASSGEPASGLAYFYETTRLSATVHLRLDASAVNLAADSIVHLVEGLGASPDDRRFQLQMRQQNNVHELRVVAWDDSSREHASPWRPLPGGANSVAVRWQARAFSSTLSLWIDGDQVATRRGFFDGREGVGTVRVGAFGLCAVTFEANRQGEPGDRLLLDSVAIWR